MKVDVALIKSRREERAWSQEHLAAVSGLSLRTIQRVESEGSASAETRMALATALDLDLSRLSAVPAASAAPAAGQAAHRQVGGAEAPGKAGSVSMPAAIPDVATAAPSAAAQFPVSRAQYRTIRFVVIGGLIVTMDLLAHGTITWTRWLIPVWVVLLVLGMFRRRWVEPKIRSTR